ncbi:plasmid recombination protein [Corynebacterium variabile]|uniref:plasmid recombination protein n=1 Tax=Corynebacterium variabile TaxID=1727 RepID=UPI003FCEED57
MGDGVWSTSCRWGGTTRAGVDRASGRGRDKRPPTKAALSHALRSLEDDAEHVHGNPNIDPERIKDNRVMLPDGNGGLRPAGPGDSVESVLDDVEDRINNARGGVRRTTDKKTGEIKTVDVSPRSDVTETLEFIIQLDPEYTGKVVDMTDEQRADVREKLYVIVAEIQEQTGPENTVAVAEHWDEDNVHFQMFVVPVDKTGTLVGTRIMGEKKGDWSKFHDRLREKLRETGYDATFDRVAGGATHENIQAYKAQRKKAVSLAYERQAMEEARDTALAAQEDAKDLYSRAADRNDAALAAEERVDAKVAGLDEKEATLSALEASLTSRVTAAAKKEKTLAKRTEELDDREADLDNRAAGVEEQERLTRAAREAVQRRETAVTEKEKTVDDRDASVTARETEMEDKYEEVISHAERAAEGIIATAKAGAEEMSRDRATAAVDEGRNATQNVYVRAAQKLKVKDTKTGGVKTLDDWITEQATEDSFRFDKTEQAKIEKETYGQVKARAKKAKSDAQAFLRQREQQRRGRDTGFSR